MNSGKNAPRYCHNNSNNRAAYYRRNKVQHTILQQLCETPYKAKGNSGLQARVFIDCDWFWETRKPIRNIEGPQQPPEHNFGITRKYLSEIGEKTDFMQTEE